MLAGVGFWALLGLASEDLLLKPSDSGLGGFEFSGQFGDLGLLTANDLFEAMSLILPDRFPLGSPGMHRPPVVRLLAEFDFQTTGFGIQNEHASMVCTSPVCVQPPKQNSRSDSETTMGSLNVYGWDNDFLMQVLVAQRV